MSDLDALLESWKHTGSTKGVPGEWLDAQAQQRYLCLWKQHKVEPWKKKKKAGLVVKMVKAMRPEFEASVADLEDSCLEVIQKAHHPLSKSRPFCAVLEGLIATIPLVEKVEAEAASSPSQRPSAVQRKRGAEREAGPSKRAK